MPNKTILIVEDQPGFRRIYRDILEADGYEVLEAEDGEAGWTMAKGHKPNLILLDLGLPILDGFGVLKRIRADAETRSLPVIIFSVLGEQKDIQRGMELGANDYTVKGFYTPRQILAKIKDLLAKMPPPIESSGTSAEAAPVKPAPTSSYKVRMTSDWGEEPRFCADLGLTAGHPCPSCNTEMVLELIPDYQRTEGHWFTGHLTCTSCHKSF
jgi:DNA-binding response OmpR family regulator